MLWQCCIQKEQTSAVKLKNTAAAETQVIPETTFATTHAQARKKKKKEGEKHTVEHKRAFKIEQ